MGCDIHLYKEKQVSGQWITANIWEKNDDENGDIYFDVSRKDRFTDRNYKLFGLLSKGVRSEYPFSFESRGLPFDVCNEVTTKAECWGVDGHSHSYLYLHELKGMREFLKTATITISGMMDRDRLENLQETIDSGKPDWDLIYPYCQWVGLGSYTDFSIDVPATFIMGDCLDSIIDSFNDIEGDNHRIVFWFDN